MTTSIRNVKMLCAGALASLLLTSNVQAQQDQPSQQPHSGVHGIALGSGSVPNIPVYGRYVPPPSYPAKASALQADSTSRGTSEYSDYEGHTSPVPEVSGWTLLLFALFGALAVHLDLRRRDENAL